MQKYTERKTFCFTKQQIATFKKLEEKYHFNIQEFVRSAIKEKIEREKPELIRKSKANICPFSGQEY